MPFAVAGVAAAAIGAGAAIYGAEKQSSATKKAAAQSAEAQQNAQSENIAFQREALGQLRSDLSPYTTAGGLGLAGLQDASGLNGPEGSERALGLFRASPGYQFQFDEGMRAVKATAAAQGLSNSGAVLKGLMDRGQSLASQDFGTYYGRLAGLATMGQNSAAMVGNAGMQSANQMGQGAINTGNGLAQTYASAGTAQANIQGNMVQGVGNAIQSGIGSAYGGYRSLYEPGSVRAGGSGWF